MSRQACVELARSLGIADVGAFVEEWAERAAIREYEGGLSRDDAERAAVDDLRERYASVAKPRRGPKSAGVQHSLDFAKKRGG